MNRDGTIAYTKDNVGVVLLQGDWGVFAPTSWPEENKDASAPGWPPRCPQNPPFPAARAGGGRSSRSPP